jgi:hypothetical protein
LVEGVQRSVDLGRKQVTDDSVKIEHAVQPAMHTTPRVKASSVYDTHERLEISALGNVGNVMTGIGLTRIYGVLYLVTVGQRVVPVKYLWGRVLIVVIGQILVRLTIKGVIYGKAGSLT